jgi:hypothetical protein
MTTLDKATTCHGRPDCPLLGRRVVSQGEAEASLAELQHQKEQLLAAFAQMESENRSLRLEVLALREWKAREAQGGK